MTLLAAKPIVPARIQTLAEPLACSFDVFDTFLVRRCTTPDGVFERAFELSPVGRSHPRAAASYVQHRMQAEARARSILAARTKSCEVTIDEIYENFPYRLFSLTPASLPALVQAEFEAELDLCRVNAEMLRLYEQMQREGQRVGFISDTYWSAEQIGKLLRQFHPGLTWDFLYVSSEHRTGKGEKLFRRYLHDQRIRPAHALHVGDNEYADVKGASRHGIRTRHYPQAVEPFASRLNLETSVFGLLSSNGFDRLDHGFRTLRRIVAAQAAQKTPAHSLGLTAVGPAFLAFDAFVARKVEHLERNGAKVAVAFLGRDGFLPHKVWEAMRSRPAAYIEVNRRVSLVGSAKTLDPLASLIGRMGKIDAAMFADMVKFTSPAIERFFKRCPDGIAKGSELAEALPALIPNRQIAQLSQAMRTELLAYLRAAMPEFEDCTDLVLVDLGYSGSVQKALRHIFDHEGINKRLHGAYLLTIDDGFNDMAADDTAEGFISDLVTTPHAKRMLTRNVAVLEQLCCSPVGTVQGYRDGAVIREPDPRSQAQIDLGQTVQEGALAFVRHAREIAPAYRLDPFEDLEVAARWSAAILGRLLLMPDQEERTLLGAMQHDVNLGSQAAVPMLDTDLFSTLAAARGLSASFTAAEPPMWLAGTVADVAPVFSFLYLLFGVNKLPLQAVDDIPHGTVNVGLFASKGRSSLAAVPCTRTGFGDIEIRIPVAREMEIETIAIPLAAIAPEGLIRSVVVQDGDTLREAARSAEAKTWPESRSTLAGVERLGRHYRTGADGYLLIDVTGIRKPMSLFSVGITPIASCAAASPAA